LNSPSALEDVRDELTDRFGTLPQALETLLELTRLRLLCRKIGIAAIHAGPAAVALTPDDDRMEMLLRLKGSRKSGDRVILPLAEPSPAARFYRLLALLEGIAA
jgi:transcription-repair coupling factor (superfamily II helicase)